jgi:hypothetical protein
VLPISVAILNSKHDSDGCRQAFNPPFPLVLQRPGALTCGNWTITGTLIFSRPAAPPFWTAILKVSQKKEQIPPPAAHLFAWVIGTKMSHNLFQTPVPDTQETVILLVFLFASPLFFYPSRENSLENPL